MMPTPPSHRRLWVKHTTRYAYDRPVSRSTHRLHLWPVTDFRQHVVGRKLTVTPDADVLDYEDVFGNRTEQFDVTRAYTELTVTAESVVDLDAYDPFAFARVPIRPSYPLVWMPWERTMLNPYLTPVELPDTQLKEIADYAMSFVERNDRDLMEALFAINLHLFREYKYAPGSTTFATTPYDVFANRCGVCQDFTNLFVTMARLLGIPARYVCGYIYTGNNGHSRTGSDATHAWVQLYIPHVGWKSFDPTNGSLPNQDHVRFAYGRHFRDTAPTEGTLYSPATESMTVDVEVRDLTNTLGDGATTIAAPTDASPAAAPPEVVGAAAT